MELSRALWRKSTRRDANGQCIEVADNVPGVIGVRDSKKPSGPALAFSPDQWRTILAGVKAHEFG
ncbi:DUF397 domain-containing protein [Actinoplanes sp. NPDC026619]|uniref:DUF397 domain-containing protein n=1 Tax=Actinoplanes sp. NPDC026619 TaxID=3155798 RepID=UPI0033CA3BB6